MRIRPDDDPPAYVGLYRRSRNTFRAEAAAAAIVVERISEVFLMAGGDDQVWSSIDHAERIAARRSSHGLSTTVLTDPHAGHRRSCQASPSPAAAGHAPRRHAAGRPGLGQRAWEALQHITSSIG
jgi:hypothetical protein